MRLRYLSLIMIIPLLAIPAYAIGLEIELNQKEKKIEFLENQLATKSLHYEWLEEITNNLLYGSKELPPIQTAPFIKS